MTAAPMRQAARLSLINEAIAANTLIEDERWELGFTYEPDTCNGGGIFNPCDRSFVFDVGDRAENIDVEPFGVWGGDRCSAMAVTSEAEFTARARRMLERCQSKQIAAELWSGALAQNPTPAILGDDPWPNKYLAHTDSDVVTDGPSAVIAALACLEQGLAQAGCGERGMIHATPQLVTHWAALGNTVLRREGGMLLTIHDTIVISDAGYDGSGPDGDPAGESQWAYATGLVTIKLGAITILPGTLAEAMDRSINDLEFVAWRPAAVTWDGCAHVAAEVDLGVCAIGGVS